jgi:hypothetical protein
MFRVFIIFSIIFMQYSCVTANPIMSNDVEMYVVDIESFQRESDVPIVRLSVKIKNNNSSAICIPYSAVRSGHNLQIQLFSDDKIMMMPEDLNGGTYYNYGVEQGYPGSPVFVVPAGREFQFLMSLQTMYNMKFDKRYYVSYSIPYLECDALLDDYKTIMTAPSFLRDGILADKEITIEEAKEYTKNYYKIWEWGGGVIYLEAFPFVPKEK